MAHIRKVIDQQESALQQKVLQMAERADAAIDQAVTCLKQQDVSLAGEIIAADENINRLQRDIEEESFMIVATQQPVAADLRLLLAGVHIVDELERIADHAADIARIVLQIGTKKLPLQLDRIERMAEQGRSMLKRVMQAYVEGDTEQARAVAAEDEAIDSLQDEVYKELLGYMGSGQEKVEVGTLLLWVVHNLERIGDRTTNIAERVVFMESGEILDLNR